MSIGLAAAGRARSFELATESSVPWLVAGATLALARAGLGGLLPSAEATLLELSVLLAALAAASGWAAARQRYLLQDRSPWRAAMVGAIASVGAVATLAGLVGSDVAAACKDAQGTLTTVVRASSPVLPSAICVVGAVEGNGALAGRVLRATWTGSVPPALWPVLALVGAWTAVGLRARRLAPTRVFHKLFPLLDRLPAAGLGSALGEPPAKEGVVVCVNRTWWGSSCGQLYAAEKTWGPGEWCLRCRLPFRPAISSLTLDIACPVSADAAVLNALERVDGVSWPRGAPFPTGVGSVSGAPRWVIAGQITVPAVLPVSQVLALAHAALPGLEAHALTPAAREAVALAARRASRLVGWLWVGDVRDRLHLATPSASLALVRGGAPIGSLVGGGGERLTLQLDVGLLPIEVRAGFVHQRLRRRDQDDRGRVPSVVVGNLRYVTWIPTAPEAPEPGGAWLPRLEGEALRRWLEREENRAGNLAAGSTRPTPYLPYRHKNREKPTILLIDAAREALGEHRALDEIDLVTDPSDPAGVDLVLARMGGEGWTTLLARAREAEPPVPVIALVDGAPPQPREVRAAGLETWLRVPLEPGDAEVLVSRARGAAAVRASSGADPEEEGELDYVLCPAVGMARDVGGPADASLLAWHRIHTGDPADLEPALDRLPLGASVVEWDWIELGLLARLRREMLVLVAAGGGK